MSGQASPLDVLVVHARSDAVVARALGEALRHLGLSCASASEADPGTIKNEVLIRRLDSARCTVILISARWPSRHEPDPDWYRAEAVAWAIKAAASEGGPRLIPIVSKGAVDKIPFGLTRIKPLELPGPIEGASELIAAQLAAILQAAAPPSRSSITVDISDESGSRTAWAPVAAGGIMLVIAAAGFLWGPEARASGFRSLMVVGALLLITGQVWRSPAVLDRPRVFRFVTLATLLITAIGFAAHGLSRLITARPQDGAVTDTPTSRLPRASVKGPSVDAAAEVPSAADDRRAPTEPEADDTPHEPERPSRAPSTKTIGPIASTARRSDGRQCGRLFAGEVLTADDHLDACNGRYRLSIGDEGRLAILDRASLSEAIWSTPRADRHGGECTLQADGSLVLYDSDGRGIWSTDTAGSGAHTLHLRDTGILVLQSDRTVVWTSESRANPPPPGDGQDAGLGGASWIARSVPFEVTMADGSSALWEAHYRVRSKVTLYQTGSSSSFVHPVDTRRCHIEVETEAQVELCRVAATDRVKCPPELQRAITGPRYQKLLQGACGRESTSTLERVRRSSTDSVIERDRATVLEALEDQRGARQVAVRCNIDPSDDELGIELRLLRDAGDGVWIDRSWDEPPQIGERLRLVVYSNRDVHLTIWLGQMNQRQRPTPVWPPDSGGAPNLIRSGLTMVLPPGEGAFVIDAADAHRGWTLVMATERIDRHLDPWRPPMIHRAIVEHLDDVRHCLRAPTGVGPFIYQMWR